MRNYNLHNFQLLTFGKHPLFCAYVGMPVYDRADKHRAKQAESEKKKSGKE